MSKRTWIKVKRGLLEPKHRDKIGQAIWTYLYMLDRADWEQGAVLIWKDKEEAVALDISVPALRMHRERLKEHGYISTERTGRGLKVTLHNWTNPREYGGDVYHKKASIGKSALSETTETASDTLSDTLSVKSSLVKNTPSLSHTSHITHHTKELKDTAPNGASQNKVRKYAEDNFKKTTGLTVPPRNSEASELWWVPLREICELGEWDKVKINDLITRSYARLRENNLTISSPKSLLKTCRAIRAEKSNGNTESNDESIQRVLNARPK